MSSSTGLKVAFINPPYLAKYSRPQRSPGVVKSGTMYYPYWLAQAAAVSEKAGHEIFLFDCPAADKTRENLLDALNEMQPDLCVIETSTASSQNDFVVAQEIKKLLPSTKVIMTGTHATALWSETLADHSQIDYIAIGEYDYIIRDLAAVMLRSKNESKPLEDLLPEVAALGFRLGGQITRGAIREPIENMDELPWIAPIYKRFLESKNYFFSIAHYPMVMLIGGRGCVAKCTYCVYPQVMHGHHYRTRSPANIVGEMKWIQDNMPEVREIVFEDDTFTGDRDYAREVARLVKENGIHLPWFANVRANIDKETLSLMKESGFRCCAVGFESGDDLILKNMWKGSSLERQKKFVEDCRDLGILVHGCFMVGFPGETYDTMNKTLKHAMDIRPDSAQFYPVMPFPGTTYYKWAHENGFLATAEFEKWLNDKGQHQCVLNLPGLPPEKIERFCEKAYHRFYFRPRYMFFKLKQAVLKPSEGWRSITSFINYLVHILTKPREKVLPFKTAAIPVPENWYRLHQQPKGRMFEQETQLASLKKQTADSADFSKLAKQHPDL